MERQNDFGALQNGFCKVLEFRTGSLLQMARHNGGWTKEHRSIIDHWVYKHDGYYKIWSWFRKAANHSPTKAFFDGQELIIARGQVLTSMEEIASKTSTLSRTGVSNFLEKLEKAAMITQQRSKRGTLITILNYCKYQDQEIEDTQQTGKTDATDTQHRRNTDATDTQHRRNTDARNEELRIKNEELRREEEERGDACATSPRQLAILWNSISQGRLKTVDLAKFTSTAQRWKKAKARLAEYPDLGYWEAVITRIAASAFCRGSNQRGWVANFDFLIKPDTHIKTLEGDYDDKKPLSIVPKRSREEENEYRAFVGLPSLEEEEAEKQNAVNAGF